MSDRWNNQTQDWEVVEETLAETLKEQVVELPPVVDTLEEFGKESIKNVELVEMPIEVVNAKPSHFGFEVWHGVLGIIVLVVAWRWLKK